MGLLRLIEISISMIQNVLMGVIYHWSANWFLYWTLKGINEWVSKLKGFLACRENRKGFWGSFERGGAFKTFKLWVRCDEIHRKPNNAIQPNPNQDFTSQKSQSSKGSQSFQSEKSDFQEKSSLNLQQKQYISLNLLLFHGVEIEKMKILCFFFSLLV